MKQIFQEIPVDQRQAALDAHADDIIQAAYYSRELTDEEKERLGDRVVAATIELDALNEEKKNIMDQFKEKIDPLTKEIKTAAGDLRLGKVRENGILYVFDEDDGYTRAYNALGLLVEEKRTRAGKQLSINKEFRKTI